MNLNRATALILCAGLLAIGSTLFAQRATPRVSEFEAKASDGKTYTLKSLTKDGPVVLYFISETCPVNEEAVKYFKAIDEAYKGQANIIGVINSDLSGYKAWNYGHRVKFPVLLDSSLSIIRSYRVAASPTIIVVDKSGEVLAAHHGYSQSSLKELNKSISSRKGIKPPGIDFGSAPTSMSFG